MSPSSQTILCEICLNFENFEHIGNQCWTGNQNKVKSLLKNPDSVVLLCSQILWSTEEVNISEKS